jgi:RNA polymerase sigma factor (sigma-70 family)
LTGEEDEKHYHLIPPRSGLAVSQSHFNDVFHAQREVLLRTLRRIVGNHSAAEDLLQETWLRVTRALTERPIEHLEPFVYQTARNLALDHLRARRLHGRTMIEDVPVTQLESVVAQLGSPEDAAHANRLLESLCQNLRRLSPRQQKIFTLNRIHGCSYLEIAEQLGVSASTVQKELKLIMAICMAVVSRLDPP